MPGWSRTKDVEGVTGPSMESSIEDEGESRDSSGAGLDLDLTGEFR